MEEIELARKRKHEIEEQLQFEIARAIDGFREQFGLGITGVTVRMIEVTNLDSRTPEFCVSRVDLEVERI